MSTRMKIPKSATILTIHKFETHDGIKGIVESYEAYGSLGYQSDYKYIPMFFIRCVQNDKPRANVLRFTGKNIAAGKQKLNLFLSKMKMCSLIAR